MCPLWVLGLLLVPVLTQVQISPGIGKVACCRGDEDRSCDCSHSGLTAVPSVPDQTWTLDLDYNQISEIHRADLQRLRELRTLTLHGNRLRRIDSHAFSALTNLKELDLSENCLTAVDHHWFSHLGALESLHLHSNKYKTLGAPALFQPLVRLRSLSFGGDSLEEIRHSDLQGLGGLQRLHVDADNLQRFEAWSLSQIWPLDHVTVSLRTPFLSNTSLASAVIRDVSHPETELCLENIHLENNRSVQPFREVVEGRVRRLSLRNVFLTDEMTVEFLKATDGALFSTLSFNNLTLQGVGRWEKARETDHRSVEEIFVKDVLVLSNFNFTTFLPLSFLLKYLRKISLINAQVFVMPCLTSGFLRNLEYLDFSENLLTDLTVEETLCEGAGVLQDLRVLNLSANAIKSLSLISRMVSRLSFLSHVDISRNGFSSMPESCSWPESLRFLNISRAKLSSATSCLPSTLQVLDLSYNNLQSFLLELPALKELHLSGNKLLTLPPGRLFPNLQSLTVQSNTLNFFSRSDLLSFPRLQNFEAGFNKFVCSCGFVPFFRSLTNGEMNVTLTDSLHSYSCDSPLHLQGAALARVHRSVVECHRVLVVSVSCGVVLVMLVGCGVVLWRVHAFWYLRMMFVWLVAKRRRRRRRQDETERFLVTYDAFVSYSEKDSAWVDNYLLPELEHNRNSSESSPDSSPVFSPETSPESSLESRSESRSESSPESGPEPLRLCLHHRDFLPGRWIMDNIVSAIESSRRTLFVLSHNFVRSDWCRYELDFTHFQLLEGNCREDAAILVLLEPLSHDEVPKRFCRLRQLLRSTTYLAWPQDPDQRDQFWTSLRQALSPDSDRD